LNTLRFDKEYELEFADIGSTNVVWFLIAKGTFDLGSNCFLVFNGTSKPNFEVLKIFGHVHENLKLIQFKTKFDFISITFNI
jgi:hypothetical protein